MLYINTETNEFGITHDMLVSRLSNISFPYGIKEIDKFKSYERTERPTIKDYQNIIEVTPVEGIQTWQINDKDVTPEYMASSKLEMKAKVTEKRWMVESSGLTFPNGVSVKTSKDDQDRILSVIVNSERNGIDEIDFKAESGWTKINIFALKELAKELTFFIQHCFKTEKYHHNYIDSLDSISDIYEYDYTTDWAYINTNDSTSELNIYNISLQDSIILLYNNFIFPINNSGILYVKPEKYVSAQALLDKHYYGMKDLLPTQFYYLLAKSGLDEVIDVLLPALKVEDLIKYSNYKSYLNGARYYEFSKAYMMYLDIKEKILVVNPDLNYNIDQLKLLWTEASEAQL